MTYIYALIDPRTQECRYIGKANDPKTRLRKHKNRIGNEKITRKNSWLMSLMAKGLTPELVVVEQVAKAVWAETEQFWIQYFTFIGSRLTNLTRGGEGTEGVKLTEEQRKKISEKAKLRVGPLNPNYGNKYSEESRRKISEAATGRKISSEDRAKRSVVMREVVNRPEVKEKMTAHRAKGVSEETRKKLSEAGKGRTMSAETKVKLLAANKGRKLSPKQVEAIRKRNTGLKRSAEVKAQMSAKRKGIAKSPEHVKHVTESVRRTKAIKMLEAGKLPDRSTIRRWIKEGVLKDRSKESIQQAILDLAKGK